MSLSEKLAQAAAARARREASETATPRPDHDVAAGGSYAFLFEDVTIDLTSDVAAVRPTGEPDAAPVDVTHTEAGPTADDRTDAPHATPASSGATRGAGRTITIDELKRRRAARFAMRPAPPTPFDTPAAPLPAPRPSIASPTPASLDDAQRQALLERLAGLRVERYLDDDHTAGPAALTAVPSGERVTQLLRRRPASAASVATHDARPTAVDGSAEADTTTSVGAASLTTDAPVEQEPVVLDDPADGDPFAGLRPNTKNLPQPRSSRLRRRRTREREPIRATAPAQAAIPGPRCSTCGGPARIDIVDRASQRRHLSCVCCGRLWEERLDG